MSRGADIASHVISRAGDRCEYCRMHQSLQGATFHVEHIVPMRLGGATELENLALACPGCNLRKGPRVVGIDDQSGREVRLFHPRQDAWADHFEWDGFRIAGITPEGRATVDVLQMNTPRRLQIREAERLFELFPPS